MTCPADFTDAQRRHWKDAELLFAHDRWANADHLYGLSAECGLKAVMLSLGMPVDSRGAPKSEKHHLPKLWSVFEDFAARKRDGEVYLALLPNDKPFAAWSMHNRYAHRRYFEQEQVKPYRDAAGEICRMVEQTTMEGRL